MKNLQDPRVASQRPSLIGAGASVAPGCIASTAPTRVLADLAGRAGTSRRSLQRRLAVGALALLAGGSAWIAWSPSRAPAAPTTQLSRTSPPTSLAAPPPSAAALAPAAASVVTQSQPQPQAQPARIVAAEPTPAKPSESSAPLMKPPEVVATPRRNDEKASGPRPTRAADRPVASVAAPKAPPQHPAAEKQNNSDSELLAAILRRGHGNGVKPVPATTAASAR